MGSKPAPPMAVADDNPPLISLLQGRATFSPPPWDGWGPRCSEAPRATSMHLRSTPAASSHFWSSRSKVRFTNKRLCCY